MGVAYIHTYMYMYNNGIVFDRQELQHFVTVMESYVTNQIFHVSWKSFESNIDEVHIPYMVVYICHSSPLHVVPP